MKPQWSTHAPIGAILLVLPVVLASQAPVDLSGKWTLDTYLSDNPEQIAAALRIDTGQGGGEALFGDIGWHVGCIFGNQAAQVFCLRACQFGGGDSLRFAGPPAASDCASSATAWAQ